MNIERFNFSVIDPVPPAPPNTSDVPALVPLPAPEAPFSGATAGDAMSMLYTAISEQRQNSLDSGKEEVAENEKVHAAALLAQHNAMVRAEEDKPHGFLSDLEKVAMDVAKVAAVVGSVAVTVGTAGAGSPLIVAAAIALSVGGTIVSETNCFGSASSWVGLGLTVAGSAIGLGLSMGVTGLTAGAKLLTTSGNVAEIVGGAASVTGGAAHIANGVSQEHVQQDLADETQATQQADRADRLTQWVLDEMKADDKSYQTALQSLAGAIQTNDNANASTTAIRG